MSRTTIIDIYYKEQQQVLAPVTNPGLAQTSPPHPSTSIFLIFICYNEQQQVLAPVTDTTPAFATNPTPYFSTSTITTTYVILSSHVIDSNFYH